MSIVQIISAIMFVLITVVGVMTIIRLKKMLKIKCDRILLEKTGEFIDSTIYLTIPAKYHAEVKYNNQYVGQVARGLPLIFPISNSGLLEVEQYSFIITDEMLGAPIILEVVSGKKGLIIQENMEISV